MLFVAVVTFHASVIATVWTTVNLLGVLAAFAGLIDAIGDKRALMSVNARMPVTDYYTRLLIAKNSIRVSVVRLVTLLAFAGIGIDSMFIPPSEHQTIASVIFALVFIALAMVIIFDTFASRRVRTKVITYYLQENARHED